MSSRALHWEMRNRSGLGKFWEQWFDESISRSGGAACKGCSTAGGIETGNSGSRFTRCERPPIDSCPLFCPRINCNSARRTAGWLDRSNNRRRLPFATCYGALIQAKPRDSVSWARRQYRTKAIWRFANWHGTMPKSTAWTEVERFVNAIFCVHLAERDQPLNMKHAITIQCNREDCSLTAESVKLNSVVWSIIIFREY